MWPHRRCHKAWIFMLSQHPSSQARFSEQTRSGWAFPLKNKDNANASKCSTPMYYCSSVSECKNSACNNGPEGKRERERGPAQSLVKSDSITFWRSYIILNTAQRSGTVTHVLKRVKATLFWYLGFYSCNLAVCLCFSLAGNEEPFSEEGCKWRGRGRQLEILLKMKSNVWEKIQKMDKGKTFLH